MIVKKERKKKKRNRCKQWQGTFILILYLSHFGRGQNGVIINGVQSLCLLAIKRGYFNLNGYVSVLAFIMLRTSPYCECTAEARYCDDVTAFMYGFSVQYSFKRPRQSFSSVSCDSLKKYLLYGFSGISRYFQ